MKQNYFIVVLAHSFHGRLQRVHIPHRFVYGALAGFGVAILLLCSVVGSYARMASKVSNYNSLQHEAQLLRERLPSDLDVDLYFLGPKPFMRAVYGIAQELQIPAQQVRYEFFGPLEALSA